MEPKTGMQEALRMAELALEQGELPIGAVVMLDGKVIGSAHTAEVRESRLLVHAELLALEQADRLKPFPGRRRDARLFTNLEPCLMCLGAAMSFHLGEIYYGLESPADGGAELIQAWRRDSESMPTYYLPKITGGLMREESKALFARYVAMHSSGAVWEWAKTLVALP